MCGFGFKCIVDWVPIRGKGAKVRNLGIKQQHQKKKEYNVACIMHSGIRIMFGEEGNVLPGVF